MSKKERTNGITTSHKVTIGALSVLGVVGGWSLIGRLEETAAAEEIVVDPPQNPSPTPTRPAPTPWPTIRPLTQVPRLEINPLPTIAAGGLPVAQQAQSAGASQETVASFDLTTMPSAAPLPTLAPLPAVPEYVPPPPPPPAPKSSSSGGGGGGGGGNTSKGS